MDAGYDQREMRVLLFSNPWQSVALMKQRASVQGGPVIWDYHVVLMVRTGNVQRILDFDTLLDFDALLLVRRRQHNGMFVNGSARWYPKSGFDDEVLLLSPVQPDGQLTSVYRPAAPVFVGEMDLHWDADRMLLTTIGSENCFHVFELDLATKAVRQLTPAAHADIDYYDPCYLPNGNILFTCTSNYQGTPCNRDGDTETLSLMTTQGEIRRLCFDQEFNWFPA